MEHGVRRARGGYRVERGREEAEPVEAGPLRHLLVQGGEPRPERRSRARPTGGAAVASHHDVPAADRVGRRGDVGKLPLPVGVLVVDARALLPARPVVERVEPTAATRVREWPLPRGLVEILAVGPALEERAADADDVRVVGRFGRGRAPVLQVEGRARVRAVVAARHEHVHTRGDCRLHRARVGDPNRTGVLVLEPHLVASAGAVGDDVSPAVAHDRVHPVPERDEGRREVENLGVWRDSEHALDVERPFGDRRRVRSVLLRRTVSDREPLDRRHTGDSDGVGPLFDVVVTDFPRHDDRDVFAVALDATIVQHGDVEGARELVGGEAGIALLTLRRGGVGCSRARRRLHDRARVEPRDRFDRSRQRIRDHRVTAGRVVSGV